MLKDILYKHKIAQQKSDPSVGAALRLACATIRQRQAATESKVKTSFLAATCRKSGDAVPNHQINAL